MTATLRVCHLPPLWPTRVLKNSRAHRGTGGLGVSPRLEYARREPPPEAACDVGELATRFFRILLE